MTSPDGQARSGVRFAVLMATLAPLSRMLAHRGKRLGFAGSDPSSIRQRPLRVGKVGYKGLRGERSEMFPRRRDTMGLPSN